MGYDFSTSPNLGVAGLTGVQQHTPTALQTPYTRVTQLVLFNSATAVGVAPSGTMAANGAVTFTAAHDVNIGGQWLYFPAGAVFSGSAAGFYWVVMSSTTVGTVYGNRYVPAADKLEAPDVLIPVVAAGPGAFTGVNTDTTLVQARLPGGLMGPNGSLEVSWLTQHVTSANAKTPTFRIGGTSVGSTAVLANARSGSGDFIWRNAGRVDAQLMYPSVVVRGAGNTSAPSTTAINTDQPFDLSFSMARATATEWMVLRGLTVEIFPSYPFE